MTKLEELKSAETAYQKKLSEANKAAREEYSVHEIEAADEDFRESQKDDPDLRKAFNARNKAYEAWKAAREAT
jgi:hypothetical protein